MLKVCATHADEWDRDGITLRASEVLDGEHTDECAEPEDGQTDDRWR